MVCKPLEILNQRTMEYGYINDGGYLVSKNIEEYTERYQEKGEIKQRTVSVETQADALSAVGWKPVDLLNEERLKCEDGHFVRVTPFDAGERISYRYDTVFDTQKVRRRIEGLKAQLTDDDYKIIKCYEASLIGGKLPYDIVALHESRQAIRNKINELEKLLI